MLQYTYLVICFTEKYEKWQYMGICTLNQTFTWRYSMLSEHLQIIISLPAGVGSQCSMRALWGRKEKSLIINSVSYFRYVCRIVHKGVNIISGPAYRKEIYRNIFNVNILLITATSELTDLVADTLSNSHILKAREKPLLNLGTSAFHTSTAVLVFLHGMFSEIFHVSFLCCSAHPLSTSLLLDSLHMLLFLKSLVQVSQSTLNKALF